MDSTGNEEDGPQGSPLLALFREPSLVTAFLRARDQVAKPRFRAIDEGYRQGFRNALEEWSNAARVRRREDAG